MDTKWLISFARCFKNHHSRGNKICDHLDLRIGPYPSSCSDTLITWEAYIRPSTWLPRKTVSIRNEPIAQTHMCTLTYRGRFYLNPLSKYFQLKQMDKLKSLCYNLTWRNYQWPLKYHSAHIDPKPQYTNAYRPN